MERATVFAHDVALDDPVGFVRTEAEGPIGPDGWVQVVRRIVASQRSQRDVGAFQAVGKGGAAGGEPRVHGRQRGEGVVGQDTARRHQEIDVAALGIEVAERERAVGVEADQLVAQRALYLRKEASQQRIDGGIAG